MSIPEDPQHPILDRAWEYRIDSFHFEVDHEEPNSSFLDIAFRKNGSVRKLRFLAPRDLEIEKGFPAPTGGMMILDVSSRQLEGVGVQVVDREASHGAVTFLAREVVEVDQS